MLEFTVVASSTKRVCVISAAFLLCMQVARLYYTHWSYQSEGIRIVGVCTDDAEQLERQQSDALQTYLQALISADGRIGLQGRGCKCLSPNSAPMCRLEKMEPVILTR